MQFLMSLLAGGATTLSPCVLPILPLVAGSAIQRNKYGPLYMAIGMIFAFTFVGVGIANLSTTLGITASGIRVLSAYIFIVTSFAFITPWGRKIFKKLMTPISGKADQLASKAEGSSMISMFLFGALLGVIWSPCSGPTLGVAIGLAVQEGSRLIATAMFLVFGLGATLPLLLMSYGTRSFLLKRKGTLISLGEKGQYVLGVLILFYGVGILAGWDKWIEIQILKITPDWLTNILVGL